MKQLEERRTYTQRQYTVEQISEALSVFMAEGGSIISTQRELNNRWGFSPTEPTLRKWISSSNETLIILDERTISNLQVNVARIVELVYEQLVKELESGNFPASKLGTLWGIGIDKFIKLAAIKTEIINKSNKNKDIIADELYSDKTDIFKALIEDGKIPN